MSDEGEDPSPPQHKRKIKKVMVLSSASSSDSDDSGPTTSTRRKRLRVLSEEDSDSSSGSWAMGAIRRRRALPGLRDSDGESDSSGWATDHSDGPVTAAPSTSAAPSKSPSRKAPKATSGFSSDSSEGNSEKCSICLMKFLNQEVGTPQNCEHIFCLDCIMEWSRNMNTCPVDRIMFHSIVVRACAGGRVLRTEPVKVAERPPSLEMMIIEDPTVCEICRNADHEESMLLCDGCDLGFHMQCLTPPLTRIPEDQWLCRYCDNVWRSGVLETHDGPFRATREAQHWSNDDLSVVVPSTSRSVPSTSRRTVSSSRPVASTSRTAPASSRTSRALGGASSSARRTNTRRTRKRKYKRRTRTVIVEYEVEGEGKIPITKTKRVKARVKKRKLKKRQPRTAARRTHVLASVRAKLASIRSEPRAGPPGPEADLSARRASAGIPALSLFGSTHQLDYFEGEDDDHVSESASTAVAARPTSAILSAYRQARRKMVTIPSPTLASTAPDLLSNILESQALLHSKRSVVSVTVDGNVNIKLETRERKKKDRPEKNIAVVDKDKPLVEKKEVDLTKGEGTRQAPMYPGQGRGWGGGYRYPREQNNQHHNQNHANQGYGRGGYDNGYAAPARAAPGHFERRDDNNGQFNEYDNRRPHHYANDDDPWHDRDRRAGQNRGPNNQRQDERRFSGGGPLWRGPRPTGPPLRQSFGAMENPLDMRMGHDAGPPSAGYSRGPSSLAEPSPDKPQPYRPLPHPPSFELEAAPAPDQPGGEPDEDERSDEGLIIDTDKYDPTEPTRDDDSGEEQQEPLPPPQPPRPPDAPCVDAILAGISSSGLHVPADILDSAVRQALEEHRALLGPAAEGDCPNFSIYSATSVHIASDCGRPPPVELPLPRRDSLEDLVQEDGEDLVQEDGEDLALEDGEDLALEDGEDLALEDGEDLALEDGQGTPPPPLAPEEPPNAPSSSPSPAERSLQEYKAKVSKRCPITTCTRNPIKIKLLAPSLMKRHVSLYDDEDVDPDVPASEPALAGTSSPEPARAGDVPAEADPIQRDETPSEPEEPPAEVERPTTPEDARPGAAREPSTPRLTDSDVTPDRLEAADADEDGTKPDSEESASSRSGSGARAAKMTESISETEDERSYTPCLDERKEAPPTGERPIDELGTELISEEEAQDMFSEGSPAPPAPAPPEDGEILDKRPKDDSKRRRRKEAKKGRKRGDLAFKKLRKGKERNYRDKDKAKRRSGSSSGSRDRRRRKDKRKDLERYDVRTLVSERRRRTKDAFGRDVSPAGSEPLSSPAAEPSRARASLSPRRARSSPSPKRGRPSPSPRRGRFSPSPLRRVPSPSPRRTRQSPSPRRGLRSPSPRRARPASASPRGAPSAASGRRSPSPKRRRKRSGSRAKGSRRKGSPPKPPAKPRKRRRSGSPAPSPKPVKAKKKKRSRAARAESKARSPVAAPAAAGGRRRSARRKRVRRRSASPAPCAEAPAPGAWSPPRVLSPRTPPPAAPVPLEERRRRRDTERAHRRLRDAAGPSKEVFTSGDNILVSVSFKEQPRGEAVGRRARRLSRRRRRLAAPDAGPKPVAIIDLERSPFRELTPSPKHVIVLSDDEAESSCVAPAAPAPEAAPAQGPKTPPDPTEPAAAVESSPPKPAPEASEGRGPLTPPEPPDSPDAYDPYEPTRSASGSPAPLAAPLERPSMTLEAAQKTNLSADEVLDRRPLSPIEKVLALLQSTRDESPEAPVARAAGASPGAPPEPPAALLPPAPVLPGPLLAGSLPGGPLPAASAAPAPRVQLPEAPRAAPKLFLAKPSPIKSDPIKPMPQASKLSRLPLPAVVAGVRRRSLSPAAGASPYSPGSSDFGDLFEPPQPLYKRTHKRNGKKRNKSKTTVDVKLDDDNLKILDELPSSAVEMQVKSKFLKKLNRQERVVEEVKLVLKPHYNKKHVSKDEYKHILRRAVPKICHNKTGEINPMKIQSLVEAYVKKFRKKRKLGQ